MNTCRSMKFVCLEKVTRRRRAFSYTTQQVWRAWKSEGERSVRKDAFVCIHFVPPFSISLTTASSTNSFAKLLCAICNGSEFTQLRLSYSHLRNMLPSGIHISRMQHRWQHASAIAVTIAIQLRPLYRTGQIVHWKLLLAVLFANLVLVVLQWRRNECLFEQK